MTGEVGRATGAVDPLHPSHPGLRPDSRLTTALVRAYLESGQWRETTLRSLLTEAAHRQPDRLAAVGHRADSDHVERCTYAQLDRRAHRYACGLSALGVRPGDSVAVMLPNWIDFAALVFAINEVGAVYTGIPVAYGRREIDIILRRTAAKVIVVPPGLASGSPRQLVRGLRAALPALRHVVVAGVSALDDGECALDSLGAATELSFPAGDPAALCHVGFTSGTTGEPKGVMNTHQTLSAVMRNWVDHAGRDALGEPFVNLVASPIGHHTGFLWGVLLTTYLAGTAVYLDRWNPALAARIVRSHRVSAFFAAPTFVQDLLSTELARDRDTSLRLAVIAGAPVPRTLPERAGAALDCYVCPAWGMTEYGIGASCAPRLPMAAQTTDGLPVSGCELRVVDAAGRALPPDVVGDLQIRGPGLFLGYLGRPEAITEEFDDDGWFRTGDTARVTTEGFVVLSGRTKDIIIRGGGNIPVAVIESLLYEHPLVREAAVIGVPDARLGERVCAVVVPSSDVEPTLAELCEYLKRRGLTRLFLPEVVKVVAELPKTASGKIRKAELRERYA